MSSALAVSGAAFMEGQRTFNRRLIRKTNAKGPNVLFLYADINQLHCQLTGEQRKFRITLLRLYGLNFELAQLLVCSKISGNSEWNFVLL